jgi:hypothetical protein
LPQQNFQPPGPILQAAAPNGVLSNTLLENAIIPPNGQTLFVGP